MIVISDDSLDVTLDKLLALLREQVGPRWYDFGEAVGIDEVVLDSIAKTTFPENCIVEVLEYWLKYFDDGTLTWSDVATALRDINLQELAYHIEQVYGVEAGMRYQNTQQLHNYLLILSLKGQSYFPQ